MTDFLDGPAQGVSLLLRRAPVALRLVKNADGRWDALDQLNDEATDDEEIYVYVLVSSPTQFHLRGRHVSGWWASGKYRLLESQPERKHLHPTDSWQAWCIENEERLMTLFQNHLKELPPESNR